MESSTSSQNKNRTHTSVSLAALSLAGAALSMNGCSIPITEASGAEPQPEQQGMFLEPAHVAPVTSAKTLIAAAEAVYPVNNPSGEGWGLNSIQYKGDAVSAVPLKDGRIVFLRSDTAAYPGNAVMSSTDPKTKSNSMPRNSAACYDPGDLTVTSLNRFNANEDTSTESFFARNPSAVERRAFIKRQVGTYKENRELAAADARKKTKSNHHHAGDKQTNTTPKTEPMTNAELRQLANHVFETRYPDETYEWQTSSFLGDGNKVIAFTEIMGPASDKPEDKKGEWNFRAIGSKLHILDFGSEGCDTVLETDVIDTPATAEGPGGVMWGAGSVYDEKEGYAYILGSQLDEDPYAPNNYYLSRVKLDDITDTSKWQYWDGSGYSSNIEAKVSAFNNARNALDLSYDPVSKEFVLTYQDSWSDPESHTIHVYEQRGETVLDALQTTTSRQISGELPGDLRGRFSYLPNLQSFQVDGKWVNVRTTSVNNVSKADPHVYGTYTFDAANNLLRPVK